MRRITLVFIVLGLLLYTVTLIGIVKDWWGYTGFWEQVYFCPVDYEVYWGVSYSVCHKHGVPMVLGYARRYGGKIEVKEKP